MCTDSITTQCGTLGEYLRGLAPKVKPGARKQFLSDIDESIGLVGSELQIKDGRLEELFTSIRKALPKGCRGQVSSRIAEVRDRSSRSSYSRKKTGRHTRSNAPTGDSPDDRRDASRSGAEVTRISRTDAIKKEITEKSNRCFSHDRMNTSDEQLASSITRALIERRGMINEDLLNYFRRIAAHIERNILTDIHSPRQRALPRR